MIHVNLLVHRQTRYLHVVVTSFEDERPEDMSMFEILVQTTAANAVNYSPLYAFAIYGSVVSDAVGGVLEVVVAVRGEETTQGAHGHVCIDRPPRTQTLRHPRHVTSPALRSGLDLKIVLVQWSLIVL